MQRTAFGDPLDKGVSKTQIILCRKKKTPLGERR